MFGFPVNLQDSGVQKFTNDADNGFPKIQQREIFYSVKDGFFDDPTTWQTASGRVGLLPSQLDDVYIRNYVTATNGVSKTFNVYNLTIAQNATLQTAGGSVQTFLNVFGSLKSYGTINTITGTGFGFSIYLYGRDNVINNYIIDGISSQTRIGYYSNNDQDILPLTYRNLETAGNGRKFLTGPTIVTRETNFYGSALVEFGGHDFISYGTTNMAGFFDKKSSSGTTIFYNLVLINNGLNNRFDVTGNADIEIRGVLVHANGFNGQQRFNSGLGTWRFTTINGSIQDSNANGVLPFYGNIFVDNGLTLTIGANGVGTRVSVYMYGNIIGGNASSRLVNIDYLYFITSTAALNCMVGSLFDFTTWSMNVVGYTGNYSITMDPRFTTYGGIIISGTGTKSLGINTTLNGNLTSQGTFELSTFNLIVNGTSTLGNGTRTTYPLNKSGSGSIVFNGLVSSNNSTYFMNLSGGNPSVEMRGGMYPVNMDQSTFKSGTGTWTFTTNNQSIQILGGSMLYFDGAMRIAAGLTLSVTDPGGGGFNQNKQIILNSTQGIDGLSGTSQLIISNNTGINVKLLGTTIMSTGIFNPGLNSGSMFEIGFSGNYTLPYTSFGDLRINAGSGIKSLSGNTTINNFGFLTQANGQFQCSTFNLTINGSTEIYNNSASVGNYALLKSGSGNILFTGLLTLANNSDYHIDFSGGNPSVELRGGMLTWNIGTAPLKSGMGTWTFSTNNQAFTQINNVQSQSLKFDCPILIDGAITLSQINQSYIPYLITFANTINGNNANSKFAMGSVSTGTNTAVYNASTHPMATGILDTSTNLNTWIYGNANQDIKGGPTTLAKQVYRNLTLNGGGTKTLQGYVSVLNTYTLTAPATLNNNGFTLTNP